MSKITLLLIFALVSLSTYSAANIEKHPSDPYIIKNYNRYEGKQVFLRAAVLDIGRNNDEYIIQGETGGIIYRIFVKDNLLDRIPEKGDLIDFRAVSYLNEGYVVADEAHIRTGKEHRFLFIRSLAAIPVLLLALWRERHQLFGGS